MSTTFFVGIHVLSLLVMSMFILEYWRLCRNRRRLFQNLGETDGSKRVVKQYLLTAFYLLTTLVIIGVSSSVFFQR